ncbi:hypothetical protein, conserved [Leishmania tarentolae]|uniref:Uncharacterized protein n=1 Tax=Leishmania tarentolae TaxID=5689 RepID=A0A640KRT1_LEITA|nr:hypothetical protein, conserved [Leishmania tarentolae]
MRLHALRQCLPLRCGYVLFSVDTCVSCAGAAAAATPLLVNALATAKKEKNNTKEVVCSAWFLLLREGAQFLQAPPPPSSLLPPPFSTHARTHAHHPLASLLFGGEQSRLICTLGRFVSAFKRFPSMTACTGSSLYEGITPLASQAEDFITRSFYGKAGVEARQRAFSMGLQSPLWLWTHQQITRDASVPKGMRKMMHLIQWMHGHGVESRHIAILVPFSWKAMCQQEFEQHNGEAEMRECPIILAHHELPALNKRDHTKYRYRAVLYLMDALPSNLSLSAPLPASEELLISEAMGAAMDAFVLCADAGWMAPQVQAKWYKMFVAKLEDVRAVVSYDAITTTQAAMEAAAAYFPSLVGPTIPLCCSRHPNRRQLEYGLARIEPCCKRLCLSLYACRRPDHVCTHTCHPEEAHLTCSYACGVTLSCGHKCLLECGASCNCFEVVEVQLACSHEKLLGMNKETLEPIYTVVRHVFKGVCGDAALPCAVSYETECARCLGLFTVSCFEAQEQGHSLAHRTLICAACKRRERELRATLLGELLTGVESQKKKVKAELQRSLYHQRKAAAQGLFRPGTRVEIVDVTKCVPPLFAEDDFPGIEFVDMDAPTFFQEMEGAYGTFVSNHVDVMDRSEVRNLVRLPSGKHVLVTDGGLRMIQALTSNITQAAPLMLTFKGKDDGAADGAALDSAEFAAAKLMLHGVYYLSQPVACDEVGGEEVLTDKVVRVVDLDPMSAKNVVIECQLYRVVERTHDNIGDEGSDSAHVGKATTASSNGTPKRPRLERGAVNISRYECIEQIVRLSVPIAALEPMPGMVEGKYVFVSSPERQVRNPHDMVRIEAMLRHLTDLSFPTDAHVTAAPIDSDTPYSLVKVVNPPVNCEAARGPCAVLKCSDARVVVRASPDKFQQRRGRDAHHNGARKVPQKGLRASPAASASALLVVVPFVYTVGDELTEAEGALDAAAQKVFEQRLHKELTTSSEELALRHEEEAFHAQQQMPEVTPEMMAADLHAYSVPMPLPTAADVAAARQRSMELPVGSPIASRLTHTKDKLLCKQEVLQLSQWMVAMTERAEKAKESDAQHIKYIRSLRR